MSIRTTGCSRWLRARPSRSSALEVVDAHLATGGLLYVTVQPFTEDQVEPTAQRLAQNHTRHGFAVDEVLTRGRDLCVVATPPRARPSARG